MRTALLAFIGVLLLARITGAATIGYVTTGSMAPTLPPGSLFVAVRHTADVGEVVMFDAPDGTPIVHRVVDITPEGLVTRGDANADTDQANGIPHAPPDDVAVVVTLSGVPLAVKSAWLKPAALGALQVVLLTFGIRGYVAARAREAAREGRPTRRANLLARPSTMFAAAGLLLLVSAPLLHDSADATGAVTVNALILPTIVHVESDAGTETRTLAPMSTGTFVAHDATDIIRAPALPGAGSLASRSATWAMLPTVLVVACFAGVTRYAGW